MEEHTSKQLRYKPYSKPSNISVRKAANDNDLWGECIISIHLNTFSSSVIYLNHKNVKTQDTSGFPSAHLAWNKEQVHLSQENFLWNKILDLLSFQ